MTSTIGQKWEVLGPMFNKCNIIECSSFYVQYIALKQTNSAAK